MRKSCKGRAYEKPHDRQPIQHLADNVRRKRRRSWRISQPSSSSPTKTIKSSTLDFLTRLLISIESNNDSNACSSRYKIGDSFFHLPLEQAQEMLTADTERIEEDTSVIEEKLGTIRDEMTKLKVDLYARFGKQINLET